MTDNGALTAELAEVRAALKRGELRSQARHGALADALEAVACGGGLPEPGWGPLLGSGRQDDPGGLRREAGRLLVHLGRWDGHDDEALLASPFLAPLPPDLERDPARVELPADPTEDPGAWVSIDSEDPQEIDDALCAERRGEDILLRIAIASPACFVLSGDPVDVVARERAATFYHPRYTAPMLPARIGSELASLRAGALRPALLFEVLVDRAGVPRTHAVREAMIRVRAALSYDQVQAALNGSPRRAPPAPPPLPERDLAQVRLLAEVALRSESHRISRGAWLLYRPELEVRAPRHDAVTLRHADQGQLARRIVGEAMVLCGLAAADFGRDHGVPLPYRTQVAPRQPPLPPGLYTTPADIYAMLRHMSPARFATRPGPHAVLGAQAYVQASSPLRRYGDLLAHRQILSVLRGGPARLSATSIRKAMEHGGKRVRKHRGIDRQARRYFTLVALAGRGLGQRLRGQIVDDPARRGRVLAFVPELALEIELDGYAGETGAWVELEVRGVDLGASRVHVGVRGRVA